MRCLPSNYPNSRQWKRSYFWWIKVLTYSLFKLWALMIIWLNIYITLIVEFYTFHLENLSVSFKFQKLSNSMCSSIHICVNHMWSCKCQIPINIFTYIWLSYILKNLLALSLFPNPFLLKHLRTWLYTLLSFDSFKRRS